jgi:hypothetical protein
LTVPNITDATPLDVFGPRIDACQTRDELNTLWQEINAAGAAFPDVVAAFQSRARDVEIPPTQPDAPVTDETADEDAETVDAELVDDDLETDRAWQDVVAAAGRAGMSTTDLVTAFEEWAALPVSDGDALMYRRFIAERLA